jgi:hypothetical protein
VGARDRGGLQRPLVNRQHMSEGRPTINTKRVLRIMQKNHLSLEPYTGRRCRRRHDGAVIALTLNVRCCSCDYAQLSISPDAVTNEVHPHSGLKFLSPREFLRPSA